MKKSYPFSPTSPASRRIVAYLISQDRHMTNAEIAHALGLKPGTVRTAIAALARLGYLERMIRVGPKGTALLAEPDTQS